MHEADAEAFHALLQQFPDGSLHLVLVQGKDLLPGQVDAAPDAPDPFPRDEWLVVGVGCDMEPVRVGVTEVGLDSPFQPEGVLLSGGDEQADPAPPPGEQTVQHCSAGVNARDDLRESLFGGHPAPVSKGIIQGVHEGDALVFRRGLGLADHELSGRVDEKGVGHRTARIDGQHPGPASHELPASGFSVWPGE